MDEQGTLSITEPHPMTWAALEYVQANLTSETVEALASCAMEDNRLAEVCMGTIRRLQAGHVVSDRYILGLYAYLVQALVMEGSEND